MPYTYWQVLMVAFCRYVPVWYTSSYLKSFPYLSNRRYFILFRIVDNSIYILLWFVAADWRRISRAHGSRQFSLFCNLFNLNIVKNEVLVKWNRDGARHNFSFSILGTYPEELVFISVLSAFMLLLPVASTRLLVQLWPNKAQLSLVTTSNRPSSLIRNVFSSHQQLWLQRTYYSGSEFLYK